MICTYCSGKFDEEVKKAIARLHELEENRQFHDCPMGPEGCECESVEKYLEKVANI